MAEDESKLSIEQLLSMAGNSNYIRDSEISDRYLGLAQAKIQLQQIALKAREIELAEKALDVNNKGNAIAERVIASNENASKRSEQNAQSLNDATEALARSTKKLNNATWILAFFTGIQVLIAVVNLWIFAKK